MKIKSIISQNKLFFQVSFVWLLFIVVAFFLEYHKILFYRPQGIHFTRQTDSLSFVANYYRHGMNFFEPRVFSLNSIDGKATCEFPLIYYFTALLYHIFGEKEFLLRLVNVLIVFTGFFFLYKIILEILKDYFYAVCLTFIFFSSSVLIYYTNNFLPDPAALGFTLIGWWSFFKFIRSEKNRDLYVSLSFFTLASLIKVTYLINPLTIFSLFLLETFKFKITEKNIFKSKTPAAISFSICILLVFSWNMFVRKYNSVNNDYYFLTGICPIWKLSKQEIAVIWDYIIRYWYTKYYFQSTFHAFYILVIFGLIFIRKSSRLLALVAYILFAGSLCYFVLFYIQFRDHDYYFIALIPAIIFLIVNAFLTFKNKFPKVFNSIFIKAAFLLLAVLSLNYGKLNLQRRYNDNNGDKFAKIGIVLKDTRKYLDSSGISADAKFIVVTDYTPNGSLYFLNRPGWTIQDTAKEALKRFEECVKSGADYVLLTDKAYAENPDISKYLGELKGKYNSILVYKINAH